MAAIKFNGVRKIPGRPTLVEGIEGRKYVANKILNNLEVSQKSGGYQAYNSYRQPDSEYGLDDQGLSLESLLPAPVMETKQAPPDVSAWIAKKAETAQGEVPNQKDVEEPEEGFQLGDALIACIEEKKIEESGREFTICQNQLYERTEFEKEQRASENLDDAHWEEEWYFEDAQPQQRDFTPPDPFAVPRISSKTSILTIPSQGLVRSSRGTVEMLVHANGRTFRPAYNMCGILTGVSISDGYELIKARFGKDEWHLYDNEGNMVAEEMIVSVSFDKKGNLWYRTVSGTQVTFHVDGSMAIAS